MKSKINNVIMFSMAAHGVGISGGDRIFAEFARRWSKKLNITIYVWNEGYEMCKRMRLLGENINFKIIHLLKWKKLGFLWMYIVRIFAGMKAAVTMKLVHPSTTIIYSSSEFWMDVFPCVILKLKYPNVVWVATWYQTAPNPLKGFAEKNRQRKYRLTALLYWLSQLPSKFLISNFANKILVNNADERKRFPHKNKAGQVFVVIGAVDLDLIKSFKSKNKNLPKKYEAVFQGRFHPQKGVVELIDIWHKVVRKIPKAKLAMIGDGALMSDVVREIRLRDLDKNIDLKGFMFDGDEKYKLFMQSKIVVHPAMYDSGGMASAEAMAFSLPCVGFDLKAYKSYYPKGMYKVKDMDSFSKAILKLIADKRLYTQYSKEAEDLVFNMYSWDARAEEVLQFIQRQ